MKKLKHIPDISSSENIISGTDINDVFTKYIEFIAEVDISIPKKEENQS
jgi:hypothetical protein